MSDKIVNVGTIGHPNHGKGILVAAIAYSLANTQATYSDIATIAYSHQNNRSSNYNNKFMCGNNKGDRVRRRQQFNLGRR